MTILDLSRKINSSTENSVEKFSEIIEEVCDTPEAEEIYLSGNAIGAAQMDALSSALSHHNKLRILDLTNNEIHLDSFSSLQKIVKEHPTTKFYLDYNDLTDQDIQALVEAIKGSNTSSVYFSLACNRITEIGLKKVQEHLSPETTLSVLRGNFIKNMGLVESFRQKALENLKNTEVKDILIFSSTDLTKGNKQKSDIAPTEDKENRYPVRDRKGISRLTYSINNEQKFY